MYFIPTADERRPRLQDQALLPPGFFLDLPLLDPPPLTLPLLPPLREQTSVQDLVRIFMNI